MTADVIATPPGGAETEARQLLLLAGRLTNADHPSVEGPFAGDASSAELESIRAFRQQAYRSQKAYLLGAAQEEVERHLQLDARSTHFLVKRKGAVVGAVRLTPHPFEFPALSPSLARWRSAHASHVEISRLLVAASERRSPVANLLLVAACRWAKGEGYGGVLGLCRKGARSVFERYGLRSLCPDEHRIAWRGDDAYTLMRGAWPDLVTSATRRISQRVNVEQDTRSGRFAEGKPA